MPLPDDPTPQCGYKWFSLPKWIPFAPACLSHDEAFEFKKISRNLADTRLLKDMKAIAADHKNRLVRGMLYVAAYGMYGLARTFGKLFW